MRFKARCEPGHTPTCAGTHFGQLWPFLPNVAEQIDVRHILLGVALGAFGALVATVWAKFTKLSRATLARLSLDEHKTPVACGVLGGIVVGVVGALLPPTMFWGEFELRAFADHSIPLPHVWPQSGVWGDEPFLPNHNTAFMYALLGVAKLFAITVTLLAGFRGGFIFPLMTAGASMGISIHMVAGSLLPGATLEAFPVVLFAMSVASGINCAVTRTPLATPLILATLSGQGNCLAPCLAAALTALFLTRDVVVIKSQAPRSDELDATCMRDDDSARSDGALDSVMPVDTLATPLLPQPGRPASGYTQSI